MCVSSWHFNVIWMACRCVPSKRLD